MTISANGWPLLEVCCSVCAHNFDHVMGSPAFFWMLMTTYVCLLIQHCKYHISCMLAHSVFQTHCCFEAKRSKDCMGRQRCTKIINSVIQRTGAGKMILDLNTPFYEEIQTRSKNKYMSEDNKGAMIAYTTSQFPSLTTTQSNYNHQSPHELHTNSTNIAHLAHGLL